MRALAIAIVAACGHPSALPPHPHPVPEPVLAPGGLPELLVTYMREHGWGPMHLEWHSERRWDLLPPSAVAYATRQGWKRAARQEGERGNGVEFLAMHRAMMDMIREHDPSASKYLVGWTTPPTDPHDATDPLASGAAFDPDMLAAIDRLARHLDGFATEDELGLYIETTMRPTSGHPDARADDKSTGVHNYLHNRFQDPNSPVDLGDPSVNLYNAQFWRLHGWIDHVWTAYRTQAGLHDTDATYVALMRDARAAMTTMKMKGGPRELPPKELIDAVRP